MEVYLVRHGQTPYNIGLTDDLDSSLTQLGKKQAERTAARLSDEHLTHAYSSPLRRALQTIGPICAAAHLRAEVYTDVCEFFSADNSAYKEFQGITPEEIARDYPWAFAGMTFPCEVHWWPQDLETRSMLIARAERVRDALLQRHLGTTERIVIVSHADTVGRLMEAFLHVTPYPAEPPFMENCSITRLHCGSSATAPAELLYAGDVSHLEGLLDTAG
jgi:broad specificity phosphatase PhoE